MAYTIDRPNIQLDAADCAAIKAHISDVNDATHVGTLCNTANVNWDGADLAAVKASRDAVTKVAVNTENVNLTAADMVAIAPSIT